MPPSPRGSFALFLASTSAIAVLAGVPKPWPTLLHRLPINGSAIQSCRPNALCTVQRPPLCYASADSSAPISGSNPHLALWCLLYGSPVSMLYKHCPPFMLRFVNKSGCTNGCVEAEPGLHFHQPGEGRKREREFSQQGKVLRKTEQRQPPQ